MAVLEVGLHNSSRPPLRCTSVVNMTTFFLNEYIIIGKLKGGACVPPPRSTFVYEAGVSGLLVHEQSRLTGLGLCSMEYVHILGAYSPALSQTGNMEWVLTEQHVC